MLGRPEVNVIADARRETWHSFTLRGGLRRLETSALAGELAMPEGFRHWSQPPPQVALVPYLLADLLPPVIDAPLFRASEAPDAFLHEEPRYAMWTPQIHRAP
jgi:tRNA threonylcarbamoyladenosine biosynthesis protein TsaB